MIGDGVDVVPLASPVLGRDEEERVLAVMRSGQLSLGPLGDQFERAFAGRLGAAHASCFTMAVAFALTNEKLEPTELSTVATVHLEKQDAGWTVTKIELVLDGSVPGIDAAKFQAIAEGAKKNCPISRALAATPMTLTATLR